MASTAVKYFCTRRSGLSSTTRPAATGSFSRLSRILLLAFGLAVLSGCASTLEHYQSITQSLGSRIDAVVSPAIDAIARTRFVTGSANALDRLNNKLSWAERNGNDTSDVSDLAANQTAIPASSAASQHISIAPSRCFDAQSGNSETTQLKTTARLRLRNAPSVDAVTIRIIDQGTDLTARRVTCGNWTEIVRDEKPIGFVFSAFLTTPSR